MRAFIAVDVSDKDKLYSLANQYWHLMDKKGIIHKKVKQENFHITLLFLGEINEEYANTVCELIREMNFKPFYFSVIGFSFFGKRVVFFDIKEQGIFKDLLSTISDKLNIRTDKFHAHITISRIKKYLTLPDITINTLTIKAKNLCLFKSTLTSSGPIYEKVCCSYECKGCKNEL